MKIEQKLLRGEIIYHRKTTKSNKALKKYDQNTEKLTKEKCRVKKEAESNDEDLGYFDESEEGI